LTTTMTQERVEDYFILIYMPDHPRAVPQGYVPEHILVAEQHLGRGLYPDEDVRHINGKPRDNRPENLSIVSSGSYKGASISLVEDVETGRKADKTFIPCRFQKPCWASVRAPIARKNKIFLPYVCSFQVEGDIYMCGHYWRFKQGEIELDTEQHLQPEGAVGDDIQGEVRDIP